jgi:hypothetical protein
MEQELAAAMADGDASGLAIPVGQAFQPALRKSRLESLPH